MYSTQNPQQWHFVDVFVSQYSLMDFPNPKCNKFEIQAHCWKRLCSINQHPLVVVSQSSQWITSLCLVRRFLDELNFVSMEMQIFMLQLACWNIPFVTTVPNRCSWTFSKTFTNCFNNFIWTTCLRTARVSKITNWSNFPELFG